MEGSRTMVSIFARNRLTVLALITIIGLVQCLAVAQSVPSPQKLFQLVGKTRSAVEKRLGKPANVSDNGGGVWEQWKFRSEQATICANWTKGGKMTSLTLPRDITWQKSLERYGLAGAGANAKKISDDFGDDSYQLIGVKGLPSGWVCRINKVCVSFSVK